MNSGKKCIWTPSHSPIPLLSPTGSSQPPRALESLPLRGKRALARAPIVSKAHRKTPVEQRRLTTATARDSMRRFPNGKPGQSHRGFSAAFPHTARAFHRSYRWLDPGGGDFLRRRPLAGGRGPARESQSDRGAQRRHAVACHRSSETYREGYAPEVWLTHSTEP